MPKLAVNEITTFRWSLEEDVENYRAAGIEAIGIWRQKVSDFGEDRGVELLSESGLEVSSLLWAGGFTGSDGRSYRESLQDAREAIELAARLKAGCLLLYSGPRAGHTLNHARRLLRNALKDLIPFAEEFGVKLALEPMHPGCASEWTFLTTLEDTLKVMDETNDEWLRLAFDTYHFGAQEGIVNRISEIAERTAIVHLGDARTPPVGEQNRSSLGEGCLELEEMVGAFESNGYSGYYEVELMGEEVEATDYQKLLRDSIATFRGWTHAIHP